MTAFRGIPSNVTHPQVRFLDDRQCRKVHEATLALLEKTGVWLDDAECLEMLRAEGARIVDRPPKKDSRYTRRVQLPAQLVEEAIRSAPESITIYNRRGDVAMVLEERNRYYGFFGDVPDYIDPYTQKRRKTTFADIEQITSLNDYLPNADWVFVVGNCNDMDLKYTYQASAEAQLRNTVKPMTFCTGSVEALTDIMDMTAAIVGGADMLRSKPSIICLDEPISPLLHDPDSVRRLFLCADRELPIIYAPMPMIGVSTPCTMIGGVLIGNAESLSGLVIQQLKRKGAPFIYGALPSSVDMRLGSYNYGAPEIAMSCSAIADLAHFYKLPVWGTGGCCDSNAMDAQAGAEATFSLLSSALSGANLIHDLGFFSQGLCISPGFSLILDEIVSMIKRYLEGFEVNDQSLGLDLIDEIGPGGIYIDHEHTYKNFKQMWTPRVFDRTNFEMIDKESILDATQRAQKQAGEILKQHRPDPMSQGTLQDLTAVAQKWHRK